MSSFAPGPAQPGPAQPGLAQPGPAQPGTVRRVLARLDPSPRIRDLAASYRDRHGRRARALAALLGDDDNTASSDVTIHPSQVRLPRTVITAAAQARGLEPVGGMSALVQRGPFVEPMRFTRAAPAARSQADAHPQEDAR